MRGIITQMAAKTKKIKSLNFIYHFVDYIGLTRFAHRIWDYYDSLFGSGDTRAWTKMEEEHRDELNEVMNLLSDETSKKVFCNLLKFRQTRKRKYLNDYYSSSQYFQSDIMKLANDEIYVGCGGFDGDTAIQFADFVENKYQKIIIFEPDEDVVEQLQENTKKLHEVVIYPLGVWSEKAVLNFGKEGGPSTSRIDEEGLSNTKIKVEAIDNLLLSEKVSFLQMDIEGSEMKALSGAKEVIKKYHPILAICIYHKPNDFYEIPLYIRSLYAEYKFYIRHHCKNRGTETVLYAIPENKTRKDEELC